MATTKTLTPTNQAITISAFTEKPDNRINATNDDKMADAINTLNSNFSTVVNISSDVSGLHEGVNAVRVDANTVVGNYTFSENMRGYATKNGTLVVGHVTTWDLSHNVFISSNNANKLTLAYDINTSKSTGSITKVVSGGTMDCHSLYKVGNTVFASIRIHSLDNVATDQVFCNIPSGFRPKQNTYVNAFATITHNGVTRIGQAVFLLISPNGDVNGSYSASATLTQIFFSASWSVE